MDRYSAMKIFVKVAELRSFTRAADQLGLPKATMTTAVQDLEALLEARLLQRTTRSVQLTTDGAAFLARCKDILDDVEETETMFKTESAKIKGKIRLDMTVPMARDFLIPLLPTFTEAHPEIEIEILGADRKIDLVREGIDCAIRGANRSEAGLGERVIGTVPVINAASPTYLKKYGKPKTLEDLKNHKLIFYTHNFAGPPEGFEYFDGEKAHEVKMRGSITVANVDAYKAACVAGMGICQNPLPGIFQQLRRGELVEILPKFRAQSMDLRIVYPQRRLLSKRVRVFMDWVEPLLKRYIQQGHADVARGS